MKGMGAQHPGFKRTPKKGPCPEPKRMKKTNMDHGHMNYTKGKRSGGPFGK